MIELNPLEVLKERELQYLPPHFHKTTVSDGNYFSQANQRSIVNWIKDKLNGRFVVTAFPGINSSDKIGNATLVAFEDEKELTYFMLACPFLRRK